jgi:hypothetical protein
MFKPRDKTEPRYLTEGAIREIVETIVRNAVRQQARDLEKHLGDIDRRLTQLERKR